MLSILLIGYGPVAGYVAERLGADPDVRVAGILARPGREEAARATLTRGGDATAKVWTTVESIDLSAVDLVADCSGYAGLAEHGPMLLTAGLDILSLATAALADPLLVERLETAARAGRARLELAPGSIAGIDALSAARVGGLDLVTYTARKPPAAWKGTRAATVLDLGEIEKPTEHFRGPARDAVRHYSRNAHVAAMVALAGLGLDETTAVLIADPGLDQDRHEVSAAGAFGRMLLTLDCGLLPRSTKSSSLAAMSLVRAIQRRAYPITY